MNPPPIVLASGSPRRKQLLEMLRIPFRVVPPDVDEHVLPGEAPELYVRRLSRAKAEAVALRAPGDVILAADTTVVLDGAIFEKPQSPAHAVEMLSRLQGRTHEVMTAVAVISAAIGACMGAPAHKNELITKRPAGAGLP